MCVPSMSAAENGMSPIEQELNVMPLTFENTQPNGVDKWKWAAEMHKISVQWPSSNWRMSSTKICVFDESLRSYIRDYDAPPSQAFKGNLIRDSQAWGYW